MSLARPRQGSPNKAIARAGLACREQPAEGCLASQGPRGGAPLPPRAGPAWSRLGHTPWKHALGGGHQRYVARRWPCDVSRQGCRRSSVLGRPGGWLAGGWFGQGFHQRPDLGIGVASVTTQGPEVGQSAFLRPATHRLWRHMKELGDLGCPEVPRLGWLWHRTLHSWRVSPIWGTTLSPSGATAIQRSTQRASRRLTTCDARSMRTGSSPARDAPPSRSGCA